MYETTRRSFLKGTAALGVLAVSARFFEGAAQAAPSAISVAGNHLVDPTGAIIRLTGVNVINLGVANSSSDVGDYVAAALGWDANLIRLSIRQDFWLDPTNGANYQSQVAAVVNQISATAGYVVLDLHGNTSVPNMPDDTSASTFWPQVATAYQNNPAVLFGIYNEPAGVTWDVWQNGGDFTSGTTTYHTPGMQALVDAVRGVGADNLVVAGTPAFCSDFSGLGHGFGLTDSTGNGIAYDAHIYPWHEWIKAGIGWITAARTFPLLMGEMGHDGTDTGGNGSQFGGSSPMIYWSIELGAIDALGMSSTGWAFHPFGGPRLITDDTNFTPAATSGLFVLDRLQTYRAPTRAATVPNPGFETPTTSTFTYRPGTTDWTYVGNAGVQRSWGAAVEGAQTAFLQTAAAADSGTDGLDGFMKTTIDFVAQGTYALSFLAATRSGKAPLPMTVTIDDVPISSGAYTPTQVAGTDQFAPITTAPFTINLAGKHKLILAATPSAGEDLEALVDAVSVGAIASAVIQDQGFQNPTLLPNTFAYGPTTSLPHWTYTGNAGVERDALDAPPAPEGRGAHSDSGPQAAFLQTAAATDAGSTGQDGSIGQDIEFAAPGTYQLNFMAATRTGKGALPIRVLLDGTLIATIAPTDTAFAAYSTPAFAIGIPGYHAIEFAATASPGADNEAFIDATTITVANLHTVTPAPVPVADAGFETPSAAGVSHGIQPTSGSPWTFTGTTVGGFGFAAGIQADSSSFSAFDGHKAPEGWQTAYLSSDGTATGTISQTVDFPAAGTYVVTYQAQRGRGGAIPVTVTIDDISLGTNTPVHSAFYPVTTDSFVVSAGEHTLTFTGAAVSGTDVFTLIDAVNIWPA